MECIIHDDAIIRIITLLIEILEGCFLLPCKWS